MLLNLIPLQEPTVIHVSLAFADLPQTVNSPPAWSSQLSHLVFEDLEVPSTIHSLDKAAGITSLLEEVTIDIKREEVRCKFVEGSTEEWAFPGSAGRTEIDTESGFCPAQTEGRKLMAVLEGIVKDVRASLEEDERAMLERERVRHQVVRVERSKSVSVNGKVFKHKKQRSVFRQIVSSIGSTIANLTSPSPSTSLPSRLSASQSAPPVYTNLGQDLAGHPATTAKARALRRAARAALVDAYRRFVLSELTRRLLAFSCRDAAGNFQGVYGGGFCIWILHSMRRRAQERIDQLFEEAQVAEQASDKQISLYEGRQVGQIPEGQIQPEKEADGLEATATVDHPTFDEDEDEHKTAAEADDSPSDRQAKSQQPVQVPNPSFSATPSPSPPISPTPSGSPISATFLNSSSSPSCIDSSPAISSRPTSSTLSQKLNGAALVEHSDLIDLRERLWHLTMFAESQNRIAAEEARNHLEVLSVRSRRRAWSAGKFTVEFGGRARSCRAGVAVSMHNQYGFSVPFKSSPLARSSWTAEDLEKEYETKSETVSSRSFLSAVASFPSYLDLSQSDTETNDGVHLEGEQAEDNNPVVDGEFGLYEEFPGPSPLDLRGRRGRRNRVGGGRMHRLFPVSEELEDEGEEAVDLEFRMALGGGIAAYGPVRGRKMERTARTFMGCDEVGGEDDEVEEKLCDSRETLVDEIDDGLVDPRELDMELGFGFDFHGGNGFLPEADLFDQDDGDDTEEEDEDEFKFDLSSQLERPKIRPRIRSTSVFVPKTVTAKHTTGPSSRTGRPLSHSAPFPSYHSLPLCSPLSKCAPSVFSPRSIRTVVPQVAANQPVLDISRTEVAEIELRLDETAGSCPSTYPLSSDRQNSNLWRTDIANVTTPLSGGGPEEFTLAMDLPRAAQGGATSTRVGGAGKKWLRRTHAAQASLGRSLKLFGDGHGTSVSSGC